MSTQTLLTVDSTSTTTPPKGTGSKRIVMIGLVGSRWMAPRILHAALKGSGFDVKTVFFREDFEFGTPPEESEYEALMELLDELQPDMVGLGFVSYFLRDAIEVSKRVKGRFEIPVVWGGIHPSLKPEESLDHADIVCIGEGDDAVLELAASLEAGDERTDIPNLWFKKDGQIIKNGNGPLVADLDSRPCADFTDDDKYFVVGGQVHREENPTKYQTTEYDILTARGCPYICSFCVNHISFGKGKRLRRRSVEHVISELKAVLKQQPHLRKIQFWDDVFTYDKKWLEEFAPVYKKEIGLPFFCYVHPNMIGRPQAKTLAFMGCSDVTMGVQHGSGKVRRELFDRHETDDDIIDALTGIQENGLRVRVDMISSALTNTEEDNRANMDLLLRLPKPFTPSMHGMNYFPEYKLTNIALEKGAIEEGDVVGESGRRKIKITDEEIDQDPWLCYVSLAGKTYIPNGFIRYLIEHDYHNKRADLLSFGTKFVLGGGRALAAIRQGISLIKRGEFKSLFEVRKFVTAHFVNR